MTTEYAHVLPRRGTAATWTSVNPVLLMGEEGLETDTGRTKRGDGATVWAALPYDLDAATASSTYALKVFKYADQFTGASVTAKLDAAIADLAGGTGVVVIPNGFGTGEPTTVPATVTMWDLRGGLPGDGMRFNTSSVPVGGAQLAEMHSQRTWASPSVSATTHYVQMMVSGSLPTNNTQEALSGCTSVLGALGSSFPAGGVVAAGEGVATVQSTGGGIIDVCGWSAQTNTTAGSTTPIGNMRTFWAVAPNKAGSGDVLNAYSGVFEGPTAGSARNYAAWFQGNTLYKNNALRVALDRTGITATGVATTAASATVTSTNGLFTAAMVGRPIFITGAAVGGGTLPAKISAFTDSNTVTIDRNAGATTSAGTLDVPGGEVNVEVLGRGSDDMIVYNMLNYTDGFRWGYTGGFDYMDLNNAALTVKVPSDLTENATVGGAGKSVGFFGKTPVAQPIRPVVLADVIAAMVALGLTA